MANPTWLKNLLENKLITVETKRECKCEIKTNNMTPVYIIRVDTDNEDEYYFKDCNRAYVAKAVELTRLTNKRLSFVKEWHDNDDIEVLRSI